MRDEVIITTIRIPIPKRRASIAEVTLQRFGDRALEVLQSDPQICKDIPELQQLKEKLELEQSDE